MKDLARKFLQESQNDSRPFLLYIGFFDAHRCEPEPKQYGELNNKHIFDKVYKIKVGIMGDCNSMSRPRIKGGGGLIYLPSCIFSPLSFLFLPNIRGSGPVDPPLDCFNSR